MPPAPELARRAGAVRAPLLVGAIALALSAATSLLVKWPVPVFHDEFSYLLAADTFARGRATNPPHPHWEHFETFHVLQHPTYVSKYPPAQGLLLALGWRVAGYEIVGAWLGVALACGATCWMLAGWMPPRWAMPGGLLTIVHPTVFKWGQSFWGGGLAMCGGALLIGAWPRLARRPSAGAGIAAGLGLALLANTRPFEGAVLGLLAVTTLLAATLRSAGLRGLGVLLRSGALPAAAVLLGAAVLMGLYNRATTGRVAKFPYMIYEANYSSVPLFLGRPARPDPPMGNELMRRFDRGWLRVQQQSSEPAGLARKVASRLTIYGAALLPAFALLPTPFFREAWLGLAKHSAWIVLQLPLLLRPRLLLEPRVRAATGMLAGFVVLGLVPVTYEAYHYAAPAFPLAILLTVHGLRHLRAGGRRGPRPAARRAYYRAALAASPLPLLAFLALQGGLLDGLSPRLAALAEPYPIEARVRVQAELERLPGDHLVMVRYDEGHSPHAEWVYNGGDLDSARVVWARDLGPVRNAPLLESYRGRRIWTVEPDRPPVAPRPYAPVAAAD